jgi:hypothetical protein
MKKEYRRKAAEWKTHTSPAVRQRDEEILLQIGSTTFTRHELITQLGCDYTRSARTLTKLFGNAARNIKQLAQRMSMDKMYQKKGFGVLGATLFGLALIHEGGDCFEWMGDEGKIATHHARVRSQLHRAKKKAKAKTKRIRTENIYEFPRGRKRHA